MNDKSWICDKCGMMLSPADGPHKCPSLKHPGLKNGSVEEYDPKAVTRDTGTTIEEERARVVSLATLRDDIIEIVCELRRYDSTLDSKACDAVDAYHARLRDEHKERK